MFKLKKIFIFATFFSMFFSCKIFANDLNIKKKVVDEKLLVSINKDNYFNPEEISAILLVNGKIIDNAYPIIENNYSLVPIRVVLENLGAEMIWEAETKQVVIKKLEDEIILKIDSLKAYKNGNEILLPIETKLINSSTYVPLRFISENLGYSIKYDDTIIKFDNEENINKKALPVISIDYSETELNLNLDTVKGLNRRHGNIIPFEKLEIYKDAIFINNNFPEKILSNSFYETFVNKTQNVTDKARLYASHINYANESIEYVIRFENKSDEKAYIELIQDLDKLEINLTSEILVEKQLKRYYNKKLANKRESFVIEKNDFKDFIISGIEEKEFFSAIMDIYIDGEINITSFVIPTKDKEKINNFKTPDVFYDYKYVPSTYIPDPEGLKEDFMYYTTYSGFGEAYKVKGSQTIKASALKDTLLGFETGTTDKNLNENIGLNEIIDIELVEPQGENKEITKATWILNLPETEEIGRLLSNRPRNYGNLGNWNVEYTITCNLINDTKKEQTFSLSLLPTHYSTIGIVLKDNIFSNYINNTKLYKTINRINKGELSSIYVDAKISLWNIFNVKVLPGETKTVSYKYILGTDGNAEVYHLWDLE